MPQESSPGQAVKDIEAAMRAMDGYSAPSRSPGSSKRAVPSEPTKSAQAGSSVGNVERKGRKTGSAAPFYSRVLRFTAGTVIAIVLPFFVLVRTSVWLNQSYSVWPWLAVAAGMIVTAILLITYVAWIRWKVGSRVRFSKGVAKGALVLVGLFVGYSALYISAANVKTEQVRETYVALHPMLRMAVSTLIVIDGELVVTDGMRVAEDYERMGLTINEGSLHYRQQNGYVHAVDLRTRGRAEWKNVLMTIYFKITGFRTLRHTGTADHLHVSLPV